MDGRTRGWVEEVVTGRYQTEMRELDEPEGRKKNDQNWRLDKTQMKDLMKEGIGKMKWNNRTFFLSYGRKKTFCRVHCVDQISRRGDSGESQIDKTTGNTLKVPLLTVPETRRK